MAATINGQKITIRELAEECIDRHGTDVLEGTINRRLLDQALRKKNLKVSDADLQGRDRPGRGGDGQNQARRRAGHRSLARASHQGRKHHARSCTFATKSGRRWR